MPSLAELLDRYKIETPEQAAALVRESVLPVVVAGRVDGPDIVLELRLRLPHSA